VRIFVIDCIFSGLAATNSSFEAIILKIDASAINISRNICTVVVSSPPSFKMDTGVFFFQNKAAGA
jgi:hypothetical protein